MKNFPVLLLIIMISSWHHTQIVAHEESQEFKKVFSPLLKTAQKLAQEHNSNSATPIPIIAIAGCSAVGKTHFAYQLMKALQEEGVRVAPLHFDSFIQPEPVKEPLLHPNFNHVQAHEIIAHVIKGSEKVVKPTWDLSGPEPIKTVETVSFNNIDLLLFEGEYTLCDADTYDFLKYSKLRVFMDAANTDIIEWNWQRKRGVTEQSKEIFVKNVACGIQKYRAQVAAHVLPSADYIVTQDAHHRYTLKRNLE